MATVIKPRLLRSLLPVVFKKKGGVNTAQNKSNAKQINN